MLVRIIRFVKIQIINKIKHIYYPITINEYIIIHNHIYIIIHISISNILVFLKSLKNIRCISL